MTAIHCRWALLLLFTLPLSLSQNGACVQCNGAGRERWFLCNIVLQGRRPLEENAQVVTVRTETELQQALLDLRSGQTVAVDAAEIALTDTLIIAVRNVTLRAAHETPVVIRCPLNSRRNALRIKHVFDFVSHFCERTFLT